MVKQAGRIPTSYPGVYYRIAKRIGGKGEERVYYYTFKENGKKIEEKAGRQYQNNMTPAKASHIRGERIEGRLPSPKEKRAAEAALKLEEQGRWTIKRLWDEYYSQKVDSKSSRTDKSRYELYLADNFGDKPPEELIPLDLDRLRINLLKKKSPQTVKHILALLKRIINFGKSRGLCIGTTFNIQLPKVNNLKTEDLTPAQIQKLLETIDADPNIQAGNMMKFVLFTGMRRGELFKLQWKDIDFQRGFIHIRDPKGGQDQKIPLNDAARQLLEHHPREKSAYVFPGRDGKQRVDVNHQVNAIKEKAGLPKDFRPLHGLRHTYASMLASSGKVDLYTLQKLLTHKTPVVTQRYAHLRDEALRKASDLAGDIIGQAMQTDKAEGE